MADGDITAGEVYEDRQLLERLGYGIFDVEWGSSGTGFENVRDFSYVIANDKDPKIYRHKVFELIGRYYDNILAKVLWNKFIDHKWVLSERAGHEIELQKAAQEWFENYGHVFLKDWVYRQGEVPKRIRNLPEPKQGFLGIVAGLLWPDLRELLDAGFTITDIVIAAVKTKVPPASQYRRSGSSARHKKTTKALEESISSKEDSEWKDNRPYFLVKKVRPEERAHYYTRLVARLTGPPIRTPEEAEKRWLEILEHKWYMSEREGEDVGIKATALDYYRRLNLLQEAELGEES